MVVLPLAATSGDEFTGALVVNCSATVAGGTAPGLVDGTWTTTGLTGSCAYPGGSSSDAILQPGVDASRALVGAILTDDPVNASDVPGTPSDYPQSPIDFDWTHFLHPMRVWVGVSGARTAWSTGTGHIFDWRLAATDTALRNRAGGGAGSVSEC